MRAPETRDFSKLIQQQAAPPQRAEPFDPPRPARCRALTYGGAVVTVEGVVTHRARGLLAFSTEYEGWGAWTAWVRTEACSPL
ncbi:hypothetical protein [Cellulosimicrobium sp. Marseille-Q8652]